MLQGDYLGMRLTVEDVDKENEAFFSYCAKGEFRLQRGTESGLLRYPPTTACPWTGDREYECTLETDNGELYVSVGGQRYRADRRSSDAHAPLFDSFPCAGSTFQVTIAVRCGLVWQTR